MDYEYEFTSLTDEQRRAAIEERIAQYEMRIFDSMMNAKAEALSRNPRRDAAVRELHAQADELAKMVEMCKFELSLISSEKEAEDGDKTEAESY